LTERRTGRPILRKGGQRRREAEKETTRPPRSEGKGKEPEKRSSASAPAEKPKPKNPPPPDRAEAEEFAHARGIPYIHALRIVRGETTLSEVLKTMVHRERVDHLVNEHGIAKALAGQVASGQLPRDRALLLTRLRDLRGQPFDWDAFRIAHRKAGEIGLLPFGGDWIVGKCTAVSTYEFTFILSEPGEDAPKKTVFQKHDIKGMTRPLTVQLLEASRRWDDSIREAGLEGSETREDRIRPDDEELLEIVSAAKPVNLVTRDGECFRGAVRSFGRWDIELVGGRGMTVTLFFHALHPSSDWGD